MNIPKAIEILTDLDTTLPQFPPEMRREALKLGIEALKAVLAERNGKVVDYRHPLPGETED